MTHQSITHINMAPYSVFISILVVAWALCIFMHATTMVILVGSVAASQSSALETEAKALLESGWWRNYSSYSSISHCELIGITCNAGGSVAMISRYGFYLGDTFGKFNFFRFRLFRCKIFFIVKCFQMKMISGKMIFFPCLVAFWKMLRKIFYSVVRKIEQKGRGVRHVVLENG
jgi:hypothetical protein